jgi:hypothetical protein
MDPQKQPAWWTQAPAICQALEPVEEIKGQQNTNLVWAGEVLELEGPRTGEVYRCVFKLLNLDTALPIEMACALTATLLGNDVPPPCLVWAQANELPGAPARLQGAPVLLFGSAYINQDSFYEQLATLENDAPLHSAVWNDFCKEAPRAAKGAALDELIANFDRHLRNLRFDGKRWWLIDHDMSLMKTHHQDAHQMPAEFKAHANQIAAELLARRRSDHAMNEAARRGADKQKTLLAMAAVANQWRHADADILAIWKRTSALLSLLGRRLPMLEQMIGERIGSNNPNTLTWTPPP